MKETGKIIGEIFASSPFLYISALIYIQKRIFVYILWKHIYNFKQKALLR